MNFKLTPSEAPPPPHFNVGFRNFARTTSQRHYTSTLKKGGRGKWTTAAEFPGILVAYFLIDAVGRRKAIGVQLSLATVSFLLLSVCTSHLFSMVCLFVTRGLFNGSAQTMIVYTAEVFPTTVRAVGVGMAGSVGRLGAIVTPVVLGLATDLLIHCATVA